MRRCTLPAVALHRAKSAEPIRSQSSPRRVNALHDGGRSRSRRVAASPGARGRTSRLAKAPAQMCLIHEAAGKRNLAQTFGGGQHQCLCPLDPHSDDVSMWRLAEAGLESAAKMTGTQRNEFRQIVDEKRPFEPIFNIVLDLTDLPWRQSATRWGSAKVLREFTRKKCRKAPRCSRCGIQIIIQCRPYVFKQSADFDCHDIFRSH